MFAKRIFRKEPILMAHGKNGREQRRATVSVRKPGPVAPIQLSFVYLLLCFTTC